MPKTINAKKSKIAYKRKDSLNHSKNILIACALCAVILTVSTYAWFIGMKTVNVSSFDVQIASTDSLWLSIDGQTWSDTVAINKDNYGTAYEGNTNSWGNDGLYPMSTGGVINNSSSRLLLYEKGSLTTTPGGYRLMASKVDNSAAEVSGYVAFDLFIKNMSGKAYYSELDQRNEEAVYLSLDSEVGVPEDGIQGTGIENSIRVAFAQIGRVRADANKDTITGISCSSADGVTPICNNRVATIWEPNDTKHVQNAINWYNASCKKRTGLDVTSKESYSGTCKAVTDGTFVNTYAVGGEISYTDNVDVYDGDCNSYETSISDTAADGKLVAYKTFTDTMKMQTGNERPEFMSLAPNSVTKVRIYVYIEGQDIDNYDFASLGKKVAINFGFTKERFFDEDVDYDSTGTATLPHDVIKSNYITATE